MSATYPDDLLYTKDHEWARVETQSQQKVATIGITDYAQYSLGEIVFVDLPSVGAEVQAGKSFGTVESVKAVSDLFAPVTGKVLKVNSPLSDSPEYVNEDPYDEGWMIQVAVTNPADLDHLLDAEAYQAFLREQAE